jgi:cholesterol transport system auxiliary component
MMVFGTHPSARFAALTRSPLRLRLGARLGGLALLLALFPASACSFFGKVPPLHPRYFDAEVVSAARPAASRAGAGEHPLRLGHVVGSSYLRERIAYHVSEHELGLYDQLRWTERPEDYVRRALARALFEERNLTNVVSGVAPALEIELTDFSELKKPQHAVRVRARVVLVEQRAVRFERTFTVEQPVDKGDEFALVPAAMSEALSKCVEQIADAVSAELVP